MSYKSTLQTHNTKLQEAIDKANALPEAKKIETVTGTITVDPSADYFDMYAGVAYTNADLEYVIDTVPEQGMTLTVPKGSIVCVEDGTKSYSGCRRPFGLGNEFAELEEGFNITIY